jgi:hypothetical protein
MKYPTVYIGQVTDYNCGAYGAGTFGTCSTTRTGTGSSGGILADTGYNVIVPVALAAAVIIACTIYLVRRMRRNRKD